MNSDLQLNNFSTRRATHRARTIFHCVRFRPRKSNQTQFWCASLPARATRFHIDMDQPRLRLPRPRPLPREPEARAVVSILE